MHKVVWTGVHDTIQPSSSSILNNEKKRRGMMLASTLFEISSVKMRK